jgi:Tol biopolymer transport system component/DNA-binding winged helix-turn-helix (wHTH) protein
MDEHSGASDVARTLPLLQFGIFELDRAAGTLKRNHYPVRLSPQPLAMLIELVEHAGEEVTREHLRKTVWPADTFVDFDASIATCIRKVRQALGDTSENPVFIRTVHRKGFQFIAPVRTVPSVIGDGPLQPAELEPASEIPPVHLSEPSRAVPSVWFNPVVRRYGLWGVVFCLLGAVAYGLFLWWPNSRGRFGEGAAMSVLTSSPGGQYFPALSPDGNQVAYVWKGEGDPQAFSAIYISTTKDGGTPRRLTHAASNEFVPAWSPDGSRIAFVRGGSDLMLMGSLGGNEQKIGNALGYSISWSPDGKEIAYTAPESTSRRLAVFTTNVETGAHRQATFPPPWGTGDSEPEFAPGGKRLAFLRCGAGSCDIYVSASVGGDARRITSDHTSSFHGMTWSPDGRSIVYSSRRRGQYRLWQVDVATASSPLEVASAGEDASFPSFAASNRGRWRLVYEKRVRDSNIWQARIGRSGGNAYRVATADPPATRLIASTRLDSSPQISPDGHRIVFVSDRTGYDELWTTDADGRNENELTFLRPQGLGSPRWSGDGTRIAFDVLSGAGRAVFMVDANGGASTQWTEWSEASRPSWSRDGLWIYYADRDANSRNQIWKISTDADRKRVQVTSDGGIAPNESFDGKTLFYERNNELRRMPVTGGAGSRVLDRPIADGWWGLAADGLYFVDLFGGDPRLHVASGPRPVYFLDLKSGALRKIAEIVGEVNRPTPDFCVSPDGGTILYSILETSTSQVQMIEEVR